MSEKIKIIVVDDQSLYREGLVELIKKWEEFIVVADAEDGESAIQECGVHNPDIVLMDVKMPGMDGIEACGRICKLFPKIAVVMLSLYADKDRVLSAISNGAHGYLLKNIHAKQLHQKLLLTMRGASVLSDEVTGICFEALRTPSLGFSNVEINIEMIHSLTDHEKELLRFIAVGASNRDIADKLYIGESTVKKQISFLLTKLGVNNRVQAAVFALRSGIAN